MANAAVGDRVLVTVNYTLMNQKLQNTFWYGIGSLTGTPAQSSLFTALHTKLTSASQLVPLLVECMPGEIQLNSIWYQIIYPSRYVKFAFTSGLGTGELADNQFFSANQAAVIVRRGELGNRFNVSTLHIPLGQTVGCQSNGQLGADVEAPLQALADYLPASVTTTGTVGTFFPLINNGPGVGDYSNITSSEVMGTVRTMRRRTVGRGI